MNILQHCRNNFVAELQSLPLAKRATCWFHNHCNIRKKCCAASASKIVPRVAVALLLIQKEVAMRAKGAKIETLTLPVRGGGWDDPHQRFLKHNSA